MDAGEKWLRTQLSTLKDEGPEPFVPWPGSPGLQADDTYRENDDRYKALQEASRQIERLIIRNGRSYPHEKINRIIERADTFENQKWLNGFADGYFQANLRRLKREER